MRKPAAVSFLALILCSCASKAPAPPSASPLRATPMHHLIPVPARVELLPTDGFVITSATTIRVPAGDERVRRIGSLLADLIGITAGPEPLRIESDGAASAAGAIHLQLGDVPESGDEAYELTIAPDRVAIKGRTPAGVFYGVQTFRQLLPGFIEHEAARFDKRRPVRAPSGRIVDRPRFVWRGAMLDVARHFLPVGDVRRYIDVMALHKLNRLHLHLADDQGWRIEIKSWPNLTTHGGSTQVGGGPGGFFSQQEYADLVAYAEERFITIIPEIDMPGHTNAALASYPELNCSGNAPALFTGIEVGFSALCVDKDVTYRFIDDVVREIGAITPGAYFHVGGDEVKTLTPAQYRQFIERVQAIVQKRGKQMIGWDEIAPAALLPTTIVQHWRPKTTPQEAVARGAKVIMSPADRAYLDMKYDASTPIGLSWAALISVQRAYDWNPATVAQGVPEPAILGVEAPLWTETVANIRDLEFLAFPRLAALAEIAWSPAEHHNWEHFRLRLGGQAPRWTAIGINFYRSPDIPWQVPPGGQ
jgi:hexosaminidase